MKRFFIISLIIVFGVGGFLWQGVYLAKDPTLTKEQLFLIEKGENLF